jgi:hypothetical protein
MRFTHHAKARAKKRNLSTTAIKQASFGRTKFLGGNKYKASKRSNGKIITVVYRKVSGRGKVAITAWKG